ncbi:hypothetical protein GJ699_25360 [Duganella sp. FT80W]|uniref:HIRAN domain-containing protein n=1 Tax=Duganella guangzhouensis TaxID=2666084 RepID=A0A6I2L6P9_9BURK|nr:hypothetical protein [Duganella guangzhouensis]MRW93322.1 hypothetical protein [Duganella guangzhouensis]
MQLLISLLIIVATAAVVYAIIKTNPNQAKPLPQPTGVPYEPKLPDSAPALHWTDGGRFMVEVMTESRYQPTLHVLLRGQTPKSDIESSAIECPISGSDPEVDTGSAVFVATLMPDDRNAYENEAVAVFIQRQMVGYLSQKASIKFRELLRKKEAAGQLSTCDAQIRGGTMWQGKRLQYVVVLDVEPLEK